MDALALAPRSAAGSHCERGGEDHSPGPLAYEHLHSLVDSTADDDAERWTFVAPGNGALRRIVATSFTIEGAIDGKNLPAYSGRLILR